jgi:hypothetical protein
MDVEQLVEWEQALGNALSTCHLVQHKYHVIGDWIRSDAMGCLRITAWATARLRWSLSCTAGCTNLCPSAWTKSRVWWLEPGPRLGRYGHPVEVKWSKGVPSVCNMQSSDGANHCNARHVEQSPQDFWILRGQRHSIVPVLHTHLFFFIIHI